VEIAKSQDFQFAALTRQGFLLALAGAASVVANSPAVPGRTKVLLVLAHPDDEYAFAATVYRLARELDTTVDHVVVTDGEGGYQYSGLAEEVYGVRLADPASARRRLPEIRRHETLAAGRILGIRHHYFLNQKDRGFTSDVDATLQTLWDSTHIVRFLESLIARERYDFVFTLLPTEETHGHHTAATLLALRAVAALPPVARPVVLGGDPGETADEPYAGLAKYIPTRPAQPQPVLCFDRRRSFGFRGSLNYQIVVNWVIAEHKSQGLFQSDYNRHPLERFWLFAGGGPRALERTRDLKDAVGAAGEFAIAGITLALIFGASRLFGLV
jgi:LmbE family N-acetylglucosaminyl deacetylase